MFVQTVDWGYNSNISRVHSYKKVDLRMVLFDASRRKWVTTMETETFDRDPYAH